MKKQKISRIIFSKVLEMPLKKYLAYIDKTTEELTGPFSTYGTDQSTKKKFMQR
jgi:hypothetical protein